MKRTFEEKLQAYEKGELTEEERKAFEKELDTLENIFENGEKQNNNNSFNKKEQKILRRGKWKARIQTTFFVFIIFIGVLFISMIGTGIYYSWGTPDRSEIIMNVNDYTSALTDPYGSLSYSSAQGGLFFGLDVETTKRKQVGDEIFEVGQSKSSFFFSYLRGQDDTLFTNANSASPGFYLPGEEEAQYSDWEQLENLPEGTVSSAYISFNEFLETDKVFELFDNYNLEILWFGVQKGDMSDEYEIDFISSPDPFFFGFPASPIWLEEDMHTVERQEEKGWFGSGTVSETSSSPTYEYGDSKILHEQFFKVLHFLSNHEKLANKYVWDDLHIDETIQYFEENGINHYGVVVTGPTKELLKLRENDEIYALQLDETRLWNWTDREE